MRTRVRPIASRDRLRRASAARDRVNCLQVREAVCPQPLTETREMITLDHIHDAPVARESDNSRIARVSRPGRRWSGPASDRFAAGTVADDDRADRPRAAPTTA